jgi:hypothetical protein
MRGTRNSSILSLIAVMALASPLAGQDRGRARSTYSQEMTPSQRTFAQTYLAAITGPDIERYIRLLHPRTRACITPANAEFFDNIFARRVRRYARNPHLSVRKLKDASILHAAKNNGLSYPDRPSHAFQINVISTGANQYAITALAVRVNGIWYEVLPCPSEKSLVALRETKLQNAADSITAMQLADLLQDPLRSEVLTLLQEAGPVSAAKRYAEAAQVDLAIARRVVKVLEKEVTLIH